MATKPSRRRARPGRRGRAASSLRRRAVAAASGGGAPAGSDPIRHVVLLMLENRSFDQMLGLLQSEIAGLDGVPPGPPARYNEGPAGDHYLQQAGAPRKVDPDPPHEHAQVVEQIDEQNGRFVKTYARAHPRATVQQRQQVMACFAPDELPALHALARSCVVCDRWHASVPGPTWTNRLFAMSGTSRGRVKMPEGIFHPNLHRYEQPSVFRRLSEAKRPYCTYFGDFPLALLLEDQRRASSGKRFASLEYFFEDAEGAEPDFPAFAFLEPDYLWPGANDDHPPHDVWRGQMLLADVYDALRANDELWASTLLVVSYDEHGGFYDHVVPEPHGAVPPDDHHEEYTFDRLGVRVPTLLVSPWLDPGVCHDLLDHTSLLRYLQKKWSLGDLGRRVAAAASPLDALVLRSSPRDDTPAMLPRPAIPPTPKAAARAVRSAAPLLSDHQRAIVAFSEYLDTRTRAAPRARLAAASRKLRSPADASAVARDRAVRFLEERGARL